MWSAYHFALVADDENADHRTFARILAMMSYELAYKISDYDRYHKYLLPAVEEYKKARCSQMVNLNAFKVNMLY